MQLENICRIRRRGLAIAWTNGVRRVNRPRLARGETLRETFAIGAPMPSEGNFLFVVQVDAKISPTTRGRWYATANACGPWDFDNRIEDVTDASRRPLRVTDAENIVFNGERK